MNKFAGYIHTTFHIISPFNITKSDTNKYIILHFTKVVELRASIQVFLIMTYS